MLTIEHIPAAPDPILAAIERHRAAVAAYHDAPSLITNDDYDDATGALVSTGCTTRFGALALMCHLRTWLDAEAEFSAGHQPAYGLAQARVGDLRLFLGDAAMPRLGAAIVARLGPRLPDQLGREGAVAQ